jgi:diaminopimelate epimerase
MGNPHAVIFVEDFETMNPPFNVIGPLVEKHPVFP